MTIIFNGREEKLKEEVVSLTVLLQAKGYEGKHFVVLHNGRVWPAGEWQNLLIKAGDKVDVLHFVGGG